MDAVVPVFFSSLINSEMAWQTTMKALPGKMTNLKPNRSNSSVGIKGDLPDSTKLYSNGTLKLLVTLSASSGVRSASTNRPSAPA